MGSTGRFEKGKSGNPRGRPKSGAAITDLFRSFLAGTDPGERVTRKRLLVEELYRRAIGKTVENEDGTTSYIPGSDDILKYIVNRLDGMPKQAVDLDATMKSDDALTVFLGEIGGRDRTGVRDLPDLRDVKVLGDGVIGQEEGGEGGA